MATSVGPSVGEERLNQVAPVVTTTGEVPEAAVAATAAAATEEIGPADSVAAARVDSPLVDAKATGIHVRQRVLTNQIYPMM
ncbi:hypothetical protein BDB13_4157 [Rhodococcus sp. OK302]|nr:hypothetical protein BDB13_4157 [Rhodococcus sp. OK302]